MPIKTREITDQSLTWMTCNWTSTKDGCRTSLNRPEVVTQEESGNIRNITQKGKDQMELTTRRARDCQRVPTKFVLIWKMLVESQEAIPQAFSRFPSSSNPTERTPLKTTNLTSQLRPIARTTLITKIISLKVERWQLSQISQGSKELATSKRN